MFGDCDHLMSVDMHRPTSAQTQLTKNTLMSISTQGLSMLEHTVCVWMDKWWVNLITQLNYRL